MNWFILLLIVIIILIIWWALRRNTKTYQPDFETHAHEHEAGEEAAHEEAVPVKAEVVEVAEPAAEIVEAPPEEVFVEVEPEPILEKVEAAIPLQPDDFTVIEGIGPKINSLLHEAGIHTFAQLAAVNVDRLRSILEPAGLRFIDPGSWAEQAQLLAEGKMDALQTLQSRLKGGRRVD
jgi:predicted flap endonuclease-1-like 5' DNA nuclease